MQNGKCAYIKEIIENYRICKSKDRIYVEYAPKKSNLRVNVRKDGNYEYSVDRCSYCCDI